MKNISKAILQVMAAVEGVEKNTTVGSGNYSYKGVSDKDVKEVFKPALIAAELTILPVSIDDTVQIDRWAETYNGNAKQKQSVFTTVKVKYLLLHSSGESIELMGYGHGADTMDKSAGKATTYALKNCLLYTFLTPVGAMDDTDTTHSIETTTPPATGVKFSERDKAKDKKPAVKNLPKLTPDSEKWEGAQKALKDGSTSITEIRKFFSLTDENETLLINQLNAKT
jgi:hypothetical protein